MRGYGGAVDGVGDADQFLAVADVEVGGEGPQGAVAPLSMLSVHCSAGGIWGSVCTDWILSQRSEGIRLLRTGAPQCRPMFQSRSWERLGVFSKTVQFDAGLRS